MPRRVEFASGPSRNCQTRPGDLTSCSRPAAASNISSSAGTSRICPRASENCQARQRHAEFINRVRRICQRALENCQALPGRIGKYISTTNWRRSAGIWTGGVLPAVQPAPQICQRAFENCQMRLGRLDFPSPGVRLSSRVCCGALGAANESLLSACVLMRPSAQRRHAQRCMCISTVATPRPLVSLDQRAGGDRALHCYRSWPGTGCRAERPGARDL